MALIRACALKDFRATALSTGANGTAFSTALPNSGDRLFATLHLTAVSTARSFVGTVQSASSSGFGAVTTEATFTLTSAIGSTWKVVSGPSTDRAWRRFTWAISTAGGSTGGSWNGLVWIGFRA